MDRIRSTLSGRWSPTSAPAEKALPRPRSTRKALPAAATQFSTAAVSAASTTASLRFSILSRPSPRALPRPAKLMKTWPIRRTRSASKRTLGRTGPPATGPRERAALAASVGDILVASPSRPPFAGGAGRLRFCWSTVKIFDEVPSVQVSTA